MEGFSIIIATLNRPAYLAETARMLLKQEYEGRFEIIVVDQSDLRDEAFETEFAGSGIVRYYHITSFRGIPHARNFGCAKSRYDYLLFLDDDIQTTDSHLLDAHEEFLGRPDVAIVAGRVTQVNSPNYDARHTGSFNKFLAHAYGAFHKEQSGYVLHALGANFSVKKHLFLQSGGSDEHYGVGSALGEETDLCMRIGALGYRIYFNPKAHVLHLMAPSGGCRVKDPEYSFYSMIHNRTITIHRSCRFYYWPTAYMYNAYLTLAYSKINHQSFLGAFLRGTRDGIRDYRKGVKNRFRSPDSK